jgi:hypothetical protein
MPDSVETSHSVSPERVVRELFGLYPAVDPEPTFWNSLPDGGSAIISACDSGLILIHEVRVLGGSGDALLWRIVEDGEVIWAAELSYLSNGTTWWQGWVDPWGTDTHVWKDLE